MAPEVLAACPLPPGLALRIPSMLDRLETLAQAMPHGDASRRNLLVPVVDPETLVAIDISFRSPPKAFRASTTRCITPS